ncbi:MAG: hypothetical protein M4579_002620 [Chaenotheca gracillima]|nr:MAG: hypothetical protein M4579_002620 [Chaenotheca gracillima]
MPFLSKSLLGFGGVLLAHACYSAHEHTTLTATTSTTPILTSSNSSSTPTDPLASAANTAATLPLDIILETLISVLLLCAGIVMASPALRPINWRVWAGRIEREGVGLDGEPGKDGQAQGVNPFRALEERVGFWDVRAKRKEFMEWVREQDAGPKS